MRFSKGTTKEFRSFQQLASSSVPGSDDILNTTFTESRAPLRRVEDSSPKGTIPDFEHPLRAPLFRSGRKHSRVELVPTTDRRFIDRELAARIAKDPLTRMRIPSPESLNNRAHRLAELGKAVEIVVPKMLARHIPTEAARGVLFSVPHRRTREPLERVLELDGLITSKGEPDICLEIKLVGGTRIGASFNRAREQLLRRCEVLSYQWPHIRGMGIVVHACSHKSRPRELPDPIALQDVVERSSRFIDSTQTNGISFLEIPLEDVQLAANEFQHLLDPEEFSWLQSCGRLSDGSGIRVAGFDT